MRLAKIVLLFSLTSLASVQLKPQQSSVTVQRDPLALAVLTQAVAAAGGTDAIASIQDFTASGTITYFWAGQGVHGPVTLRGVGTQQFRLDANLPEGTRSWAVNDGIGALREANGKTSAIVYENAVNLGALSLPFLGALAALNDPTFSVNLVGQPTVTGKVLYDLRVQKTFTSSEDPSGALTRSNVKDFLLDPQNYTVIQTQFVACSDENEIHKFQRAILFSDYRQAAGVYVPYSIKENVSGQETWSIQLDSVSFNNGLSTEIFRF